MIEIQNRLKRNISRKLIRIDTTLELVLASLTVSKIMNILKETIFIFHLFSLKSPYSQLIQLKVEGLMEPTFQRQIFSHKIKNV